MPKKEQDQSTEPTTTVEQTEEERRAADQQSALEAAFVAGKLPEEDRRDDEAIISGPTAEEIAASAEIVAAANAAAQAELDKQVAAQAPKVLGEPVPPLSAKMSDEEQDALTARHVDRLHQLLEFAEKELHVSFGWITKEARVILSELGIEKAA
jgi:hypothetical protein